MKKIILFGCGGIGYEALNYFGKDSVYCFADNNTEIIGCVKYGKEVISYKRLLEIYKDYHIIISVNLHNAYEIAKQFEENKIEDYLIFEELKNKNVENMDPLDLVNIFSSDSENSKIQRDFYKQKSEILEKKLEYLIKHINVSDLKPAVGYLRKRQLDLINFAHDFFNIISYLDIKPFLIAGNLLGMIRHNGFIPWDDDIDFGLIRNEYTKLYNYCKENFYIAIYDGEDEKLLEWINNTTIQHKDEFVFFVYSNHIQISKGTSCMDRLSINFFSFDYYENSYKFEDHIKYLDTIKNRLSSYPTELKRIKCIQHEIENNRHIVSCSNYIYFGIDNLESFRKAFYNKWIPKDVVFPLREEVFEGKRFWIPNNAEEFVKYEYENYKKLPKEFGKETHDYWDVFKRENLINVEFYLIDAFEISHFKPIYYFLRSKGINAIFVAEKNEVNTAGGDWFNYDDAIDILEREELEYRTECNANSDFAFTTQEISILKKYNKSTKRINISYGLGLIKENNFGLSIKTVKGFDYRFVHGKYSKDILKSMFPEDRIKIFGYPRHYNLKERNIDKSKIISELGIKTDKKIICYLPTWDQDSSIMKFKNAFCELKDEYFIITKPHHVTCRNADKKEELKTLYEISDIVLESTYDFQKFCKLGDVNICDAKSGAALESCFVNNESKVVFLSVRKNLKECFFEEIFEIAYLLNDPLELIDTVETIIEFDKYQNKRIEYIDKFFENSKDNYLEDIFLDILASKRI